MKKFSIFVLQEIHCTKEKEPLWSSEWGSSAFFSSLSSASAGVRLLFNNNFEFEVMRQFSDPEGRFIIIDIKKENKIITLVNIYAPNDDNPAFFKKVLSHLLSFDCEGIVLGGDFNLVLDVQKDKEGGNPSDAQKFIERSTEHSEFVGLDRRMACHESRYFSRLQD